MATKKQKHNEAVARRERHLANLAAENAEILRKAQEKREYQKRARARGKHDKEHSWKKIDNDCILCQDLLAKQKQAAANKETLSA